MKWMKYIAPLFIVCISGLAQDRSVSSDGGYSIQFPDGWKIKKSGMEFNATTEANDAYSNISFQRLPVGVTVAKIVELNMASFKKSLNDFKQVDTGTINVPSINSQARWVIVSYTGDNGPITTTYYFVFSTKDRKLFTLSCVAGSPNFDKRRAEFDAIARSLVQH